MNTGRPERGDTEMYAVVKNQHSTVSLNRHSEVCYPWQVAPAVLEYAVKKLLFLVNFFLHPTHHLPSLALE